MLTKIGAIAIKSFALLLVLGAAYQALAQVAAVGWCDSGCLAYTRVL